METNRLFSIVNDWNFWDHPLPTGHPRPLYLDRLASLTRTHQIIVITGPRRAGKSYLMRQWIARLIQAGSNPTDTLMVNFEDPRFESLDTRLLETLWKVYQSHLKPAPKPLLLLDEVQEVANWEKWVRASHELGKATLILSGSNAKLLSRELATLLTGRHLPLTVLPFSFRELASIRLDLKTAAPPDYLHLLDEILLFGGFPEVAFSESKREILLNYFDDLIHRDLIRRYRIRKGETLKKLASFYASHCGSQITFGAVEKFLSITADTAERFSGAMQEAYLFFLVKRFSFKPKEQEKSPRKIYCVDTGLAHAVSGQNIGHGHLAENLVFIHLLGQKGLDLLFDFFYWKNDKHQEVDFILTRNGRPVQAIQVCWDASRLEARSREIRSLQLGLEALGLSEGILLTREEEGAEKIKDRTIRLVPLWKWLLMNPG